MYISTNEVGKIGRKNSENICTPKWSTSFYSCFYIRFDGTELVLLNSFSRVFSPFPGRRRQATRSVQLVQSIRVRLPSLFRLTRIAGVLKKMPNELGDVSLSHPVAAYLLHLRLT
jgi:hypothetical protein